MSPNRHHRRYYSKLLTNEVKAAIREKEMKLIYSSTLFSPVPGTVSLRNLSSGPLANGVTDTTAKKTSPTITAVAANTSSQAPPMAEAPTSSPTTFEENTIASTSPKEPLSSHLDPSLPSMGSYRTMRAEEQIPLKRTNQVQLDTKVKRKRIRAAPSSPKHHGTNPRDSTSQAYSRPDLVDVSPMACSNCRRGKKKCLRELPICSTCVRRNLTSCVYDKKRRTRKKSMMKKQNVKGKDEVGSADSTSHASIQPEAMSMPSHTVVSDEQEAPLEEKNKKKKREVPKSRSTTTPHQGLRGLSLGILRFFSGK